MHETVHFFFLLILMIQVNTVISPMTARIPMIIARAKNNNLPKELVKKKPVKPFAFIIELILVLKIPSTLFFHIEMKCIIHLL